MWFCSSTKSFLVSSSKTQDTAAMSIMIVNFSPSEAALCIFTTKYLFLVKFMIIFGVFWIHTFTGPNVWKNSSIINQKQENTAYITHTSFNYSTRYEEISNFQDCRKPVGCNWLLCKNANLDPCESSSGGGNVIIRQETISAHENFISTWKTVLIWDKSNIV